MSKRTTLTLDDDVAAKLAAEARRARKPFRAVVNEALRSGLEKSATAGVQPYRVDARDLGLRDELEIDDVWGVIDRLDGTAS